MPISAKWMSALITVCQTAMVGDGQRVVPVTSHPSRPMRRSHPAVDATASPSSVGATRAISRQRPPAGHGHRRATRSDTRPRNAHGTTIASALRTDMPSATPFAA